MRTPKHRLLIIIISSIFNICITHSIYADNFYLFFHVINTTTTSLNCSSPCSLTNCAQPKSSTGSEECLGTFGYYSGDNVPIPQHGSTEFETINGSAGAMGNFTITDSTDSNNSCNFGYQYNGVDYVPTHSCTGKFSQSTDNVQGLTRYILIKN